MSALHLTDYPLTELVLFLLALRKGLFWEPPFLEDHPMGTMLAKLEQDPPVMKPRFMVPEGLERWVRRLLRRTPRHRFQRGAARALLPYHDGAGRASGAVYSVAVQGSRLWCGLATGLVEVFDVARLRKGGGDAPLQARSRAISAAPPTWSRP